MKIFNSFGFFLRLPGRIKIYASILFTCLLIAFVLPKCDKKGYKCKCSFYWEGTKLFFVFEEPLYFDSNQNFSVNKKDTVYFWIYADKLKFIKNEIVFGGYLIGKAQLSNHHSRYQVQIFEPMPVPIDGSMINKNIIHDITYYKINFLKYKKDI